jgi:hypothetical protein
MPNPWDAPDTELCEQTYYFFTPLLQDKDGKYLTCMTEKCQTFHMCKGYMACAQLVRGKSECMACREKYSIHHLTGFVVSTAQTITLV